MVSSLRGSCLTDLRYTSTGLTVPDADALLPHLVKFAGKPRSKAEIEKLIESRLGRRNHPRAWWALRRFAPLHHAPTGGPWSFGSRSTYIAAATKPARPSPEEGAQRLLLRYLEGFGPASAADFGQFTILRRPVVKQAIEALGSRVVVVEGPDGTTLYDVPGGSIPAEDSPAPPRLLPMWDNVLLAYADRSRVIPPDYRRLLIHQNGDVLPSLLVDGYVAGVWRPVEGGIEATAFHKLADKDWNGLAAEARSLVAFLAARDPLVYRRYGHWWEKAQLPGADVRVLPA